jgi:hypothetical protein
MPAVVEQKADNFSIPYPTIWGKMTDEPKIKGYRLPRPTFGYGWYEISPAKLTAIAIISALVIKGLWSLWHKDTVNIVGSVGVDPSSTVKVDTSGVSLPVGSIPPLTGNVQMTTPRQEEMPVIIVKPPEERAIPPMKVVVSGSPKIALDTSTAKPLTVSSDGAAPLAIQPKQAVLLHTDTENPIEFPPLQAPSSMPASELKVEGFENLVKQLTTTTQVLTETQQKIVESNEHIGQMMKDYNEITSKFMVVLESIMPKKTE